MTQENYRLELSNIYKEYLTDKSFEKEMILFRKFLELAKRANDEQNNKNAFLKYQKSPKGKIMRHNQYVKHKSKESNNCLSCGQPIASSFEKYTIEGKRPYCEKCFDAWSDGNPII